MILRTGRLEEFRYDKPSHRGRLHIGQFSVDSRLAIPFSQRGKLGSGDLGLFHATSQLGTRSRRLSARSFVIRAVEGSLSEWRGHLRLRALMRAAPVPRVDAQNGIRLTY
jgi:hypothetical protein